MTRKSKPVSKQFGKLLGEYEDGGKAVKVYEDGNQIYFVKAGKIQPDMTIHIDDVEELLKMLNELVTEKEDE